MQKSIFAVFFTVVALVVGIGQPVATQAAEPDGGRGHGHYANVNGLRMYYEVHGQRRGQPPLVLLHGSFSAIGTSFEDLLPTLARTRQVIAIEQQGHGHTADIDRPLRFELMADDNVELLRQLGVRQADFFGYSMGGGIALNIGVRYPQLVRKLVLAAVSFNVAGVHPGVLEGLAQLKPEQLHPTQWYREYLRIAPRPQDFPTLVEKVKDLNVHHTINYPPASIAAMRAPVLIAIGDADVVRPEHSVEMFRLLGGGVLGRQSNSELVIMPHTTHDVLVERADLLLPTIPAFLNRPLPT